MFHMAVSATLIWKLFFFFALIYQNHWKLIQSLTKLNYSKYFIQLYLL